MLRLKTNIAMPDTLALIGWREWVALPELGLPAIKAKIDTGARTSALHAFKLETFTENGVQKVNFAIHPIRRRPDIIVECTADIIDQRLVSDSGGHKERRYVIYTPVLLGDQERPMEITLTNRDTMLFRMLIGRTGIGGDFAVDPMRSYLISRHLKKQQRRIYRNKRLS